MKQTRYLLRNDAAAAKCDPVGHRGKPVGDGWIRCEQCGTEILFYEGEATA